MLLARFLLRTECQRKLREVQTSRPPEGPTETFCKSAEGSPCSVVSRPTEQRRGMQRLEFGAAVTAQRRAALCAGCRQEIDGSSSVYCASCRIAAGRGTRVEASGGSWIQDGSDYQRGKNRADSGASRQHVKGEDLVLTKWHLRPSSEWLPLDAPLLPGCVAQQATVLYMAATARGRKVLSPGQLRWADARPRWPDPVDQPKPRLRQRQPVVLEYEEPAITAEHAGARCACGELFDYRDQYLQHLRGSTACRQATKRERAEERTQAEARSVFDTCLPRIVRQTHGNGLRGFTGLGRTECR